MLQVMYSTCGNVLVKRRKPFQTALYERAMLSGSSYVSEGMRWEYRQFLEMFWVMAAVFLEEHSLTC
jgi:hypothetical protein